MATDYTGKGYWGKCLEVDLTTAKCTVTDRHMQYLDDFAGGRALGMKMLFEALKDKPGADPMGPDCPVMFIAGPCTGSAIAFGSRYIVVNKSALTQPLNNPYEAVGGTPGGIGFAACGGHFGPNLKWSGFDMVYIVGKAPAGKKYVLKIEDNAAELVDGSECWGMDVPAAQEWAKDKYGVQYATAFFGPAAENGLRWAGVHGDTGRAAGRSGAAASLAGRGLKGLIAAGTQMPPMADMEKYLELRQNYYNALNAWSGLPAFRRWGTLLNTTTNGWKGRGASKNHQWGESPYQVQAGLKYYHEDYIVRHRSCVGCITRCMKFGVVKTGKYKGTIYEGPDYEGGIMNGHMFLLEHGEDVAYVAEYIESTGQDCITAGAVYAFVIEAVEKGYLTEADLGVKGLTWGAADAIHELVEHCIYDHKLPVYDAMRKGCIPLCRWIAENKKGVTFQEVFDITAQCKNNGFAAWWPGKNSSQALNYSLSTRGACHMIGLPWGASGGTTVIRDVGVFCTFGSQGGVSGYAYYECLNAAMGRNLTKEQWDQHGFRTILLEKAFNAIEGFRRRDDNAPARIHAVMPEKFDDGTPTVFAGACTTPEVLDELKLNWYKTAGVDPETSCPTKGVLQENNLDDVVPYVEAALKLTGEKMK